MLNISNHAVFSVDDGTLPNMNKKIKSCLNDIIFDEHDINTGLQALPIKNSCGPDEILTTFLKILHNVLTLPLNWCLKWGLVINLQKV